jgi:phage terminase large subunit-like protein
MMDFVSWVENKHFYVRDHYDEQKGRMAGIGQLQLFPFQKEILSRALGFNADTGLLTFETVIYSTIKKSGKTALAAAVAAWYIEEAPAGTEAYCIANDLEQAEGRVMRDVKFHFQMRIQNNDSFFNEMTGENDVYTEKNCKLTLYRIDFSNGSFIQALAQSYRSVAGSRHALTVWDELWGVSSELSRRVWDEMTPIPTVPNSLRFIATYAGFENESDLLWDLYLQGVDQSEHEQGRGTRIKGMGDLPCYANRRHFTYWDHEPRLPWQTQEYYDDQMNSLRPAAFLRLHMNQWVTSHEAFIPIEWWDMAAKTFHAPATLWNDHPFRYFPIYIGVDAGIKRDSTAMVAVAYDSKRGKIGQLFHKIWTPSQGDQVDLDVTVEKELTEMYNKFNVVSIVYDPTHLLQTMLRLKGRGLPTKEFQQTVPNMTAASQLLYDLFKSRNFETYPDEDMRRHIQMAVAETTSRGFRIVKSRVSKRHHIDGAVALAMACFEAVNNGGVDLSIPIDIRSPYSDATIYTEPDEQRFVPFPLRN